MTTTDRNHLKLGTVVVLDTVLKPIDFDLILDSKSQGSGAEGHHFELLAPAAI